MPALATPAPRLKLSQLLLASFVLLNLFTKVSIFPNVQAYKAKKILYGMAAAHLLNMLKNVKTGPPKVYSHPYPVMPPPMPYKPKCKKEMHYHEHVNVLGDEYGGDDLGYDDFDDHYSGGISSKHSFDDDIEDIDDQPLYLDKGSEKLQLGKKLRHRSRASRYLDSEGDFDDEGLESTYEDELGETETDYADSSEETPTIKKRPSGGKFKSPIKSGKKIFKKYMKIIKQKASDSFSGEGEEEEVYPGATDDQDSESPQDISNDAQVKTKTIVTHVAPPGASKKKIDHNDTLKTDESREILEASMVSNNFAAQNSSQFKSENKTITERRPKSIALTTTIKPFVPSLKNKKETTIRPKSIKSMIKNMKISKYLKAGFESLGNRTAEMENWFKPKSLRTTPSTAEEEEEEEEMEDNANQATTTTTPPENPVTIIPTLSPPTSQMVQPVVPIYQPEMRSPSAMMEMNHPQYYPNYGLEPVPQSQLIYPSQQYQISSQQQVYHQAQPQQQYSQQPQIVSMDTNVPLYRSKSTQSASHSPPLVSNDPPSYYLDTALPIGPMDDLHPNPSPIYGHLIAARRVDAPTLSSSPPSSSLSSIEVEGPKYTPTTITNKS